MSSVSVDSLAYLPPDIRDLLKEVVFTCMNNSSGICSALIELISETHRDPKGAALLTQMISSGRLKGWLQGVVTNSIESKLRALEIVDDFKYLLGTAANGADEVFEKVSNLSERQIKAQTKETQSCELGLQELSSIVRVLHSNYQRGGKSESSFSISIDKYESQEQVVPIQQVLSKYGTEPAYIKPQEPLRISLLPTIEFVSFRYKLPSVFKDKKSEEPLQEPSSDRGLVPKQEHTPVSSNQHDDNIMKQQAAKLEMETTNPDRKIDTSSKELSNMGQSKSNSSLGGSTQTDSKSNLVTQIQIGVVDNNQKTSKIGISKEELVKPLDLKRESPRKPKQPSADEHKDLSTQIEDSKSSDAKPTISILGPKVFSNQDKQDPVKITAPLVFESMQPKPIISNQLETTNPIVPSDTSKATTQATDKPLIQPPAGTEFTQLHSIHHPERKSSGDADPQKQKAGEKPSERHLTTEPLAPSKLTQNKEPSKKRNSKNESIKRDDSFEYEEEHPRKNSQNKFEDSFGVHNHSFDKKSDQSQSRDKKPETDSFEDPVQDKKPDKAASDDDADSFYGSDDKQQDKQDKSVDEIELEKLDRSNASIDKPQFGTPDRKKEQGNTLGVKTPDKVQSKFDDSFYSAGSDDQMKPKKVAPETGGANKRSKGDDSFDPDSEDQLSFGSDEPNPQKKSSADNLDFDEDLEFLREEQQEEEKKMKEEKRKKIEEENRRAEDKRRLEEEKIRKAIEDRKKREEEQNRREQEAEAEERRLREKKKKEAEETEKRLLKAEEERKKKEYLEILDAKKKDGPKTAQQLALRLGRTVEPLPDQGRVFKPKKFEMPSPAVAKTYLSDFSLSRIELPESRYCSTDGILKFDISSNGLLLLGCSTGEIILGKTDGKKFHKIARTTAEDFEDRQLSQSRRSDP